MSCYNLKRLFFPKYAIHATNVEVVFYGIIFARLGYNTFAGAQRHWLQISHIGGEIEKGRMIFLSSGERVRYFQIAYSDIFIKIYSFFRRLTPPKTHTEISSNNDSITGGREIKVHVDVFLIGKRHSESKFGPRKVLSRQFKETV